MNPDPRDLIATTVELTDPPDLLAVAGDRGRLFRTEHGGVAGTGEAVRIDLPHGLSDPGSVTAVTEFLAAIQTEGSGPGPVAIGALPFDPVAPGHLTVPSRTVVRRGNSAWLTTVAPAGSRPDDGAGTDPGAELNAQPPDEFRLTPTMTHAEWKDVIAAAVEVLDRGQMDKVVLARRIDIEANRPFVVSDVLERLSSLYPSCMLYSIEGFVGASPELLMSRTGDLIESHPLAGTVARSGDVHGDEVLVGRLMNSSKIRHEHRVVVDAIAAALAPLCSTIDVPTEPSVLGLRNVSHLATHITGRLASDHPLSALELAARIHPTPAVGGLPATEAIEYLEKVEGFERGHYAGPVGWIDGHGDGCFAVGIRCAEVSGSTARLFAGNGIVSGSDPAEELAETQLKLQALLAALVRP